MRKSDAIRAGSRRDTSDCGALNGLELGHASGISASRQAACIWVYHQIGGEVDSRPASTPCEPRHLAMPALGVLPSVGFRHSCARSFSVSLKKSSANSTAAQAGSGSIGANPRGNCPFWSCSRVHFYVPKAGGLQPADKRQDESLPGPLIIHSSVKGAPLAVVLGLDVQMLCDDGTALEVNC